MLENLNNIIKTDSRFARAANILTSDKELENIQPYIFTEETQNFLNDFTDSLQGNNNRRAWTLFGPYGTGKSLLSLFISKVFSGNFNNNWCNQVFESLDKDFRKEFVEKLEKNLGNYFVVPVTGSQNKFGIEIVKSIINESKKQSWASDEFIKELELNLETFSFESQALELKSIIKKVIDVASTSSFPKKRGLIIIVDECGQFLEYEAKNENSNNLIMLQYLAEEAINSENFSLVTTLHRGIMNYAPTSVNSYDLSDWERTAGRFESVQIGNSNESQYELISKTFNSDLKLIDKNSNNQFKEWKNNTWKLISNIESFNQKSVVDFWEKRFHEFYPLHPFSLYSLPILSGILGQNTRTIFSFLSSKDPFGFHEFLIKNKISKNNFPVLTLNYLYDYFFLGPNAFSMQEDLKKIKNSASYAFSNLDDFKNKSEINLVKNMAVLYALKISGAPVKLNFETISSTLDHKESKNLETMLSYLETRKLISYRDWEDEYILWQGSGFDLKNSIKINLENLGRSFDFNLVLKEIIEFRDFIARRHSFEKGTTRSFKWHFVNIDDFKDNAISLKKIKYEGVIFQLLSNSEKDIKSAKDFAKNLKKDNVIISIPISPIKIADDIKTLFVINKILSQAPELKDDPIAMQEINVSIDSYKSRIINSLNSICIQNFDKTEWWHNGEILKIESRSDRNSNLSNIFDSIFNLSPIIKNEMINKTKITPQAFKAEKDFIDKLLNSYEFKDINLQGNGPEVGIYRSLLKDSNIHKKIDSKWNLEIDPKDPTNFNHVFKFIENYINNNEFESELFSNLIKELEKPPYGVRQSSANLLIWLWLQINKDKILLYDNGTFVEEWNTIVFDRFCKRTEFYSAKNFKNKSLNKDFFKKVSKSIDDSILHPLEGKRGIKGGEEWVGFNAKDIRSATVKLYSWYSDLEDYQKNDLNHYSSEIKDLLKGLKYSLDPVELFEKTLKKYEKILSKLLFTIKQSYADLLVEIKDNVIETMNIIDSNNAKGINNWAKNISDDVIEKINNPNSKQFFRDIKLWKDNPVRYIETIAGSLVERQPPKFWDEKIKNNFMNNLVIAKEDLINSNNFELIKKSGSGEHIRISEKAILYSNDGNMYKEIEYKNMEKIYKKIIKNLKEKKP